MSEISDTVQSAPSVVTPATPQSEAVVPTMTEYQQTVLNPTETGAQTPHPPLEHALEIHDPTAHAAELNKTLADVGGKTVGPETPIGDGSWVQLPSQPHSRRSLMERFAAILSLSALRNQFFPSSASGDYRKIENEFHENRKDHTQHEKEDA